MVGINKRPGHDHDSHDWEEDTLTVANVLMLLSRGGGSVDESTPSSPATAAAVERIFECKTCSRTFATFQALGGHRASHKKLRTGSAVAEGEEATEGRMRLHGCSVCGLEFSIGQALGGHMRRHRAAAAAASADEKKEGQERKRMMWMDLNLTPMENDLAIRKKLRIGPIGVLGDWIPVMGFSH
ncbi:hypothetical protein HPP92_018995 [Vanilla planifolia]|uniref:C2H2-type domain-containing protein n=1 Tax=Vanilla planifolia TaxID=51239 RepID=A0A835QAZ2_VANPL|nr:hypothetical protein HPP92_018995 [Vanilla planifolia]